MIYIVTALQCEANPLIQHYKLIRVHSDKKWRVFRSETLTLIVSGIGKIRSAMAIEHLTTNTDQYDIENSVIINFGVCGSVVRNDYDIGNLIIINKVVDHGTGKTYFPDILLKHTLLKAGIETFDIPVTSNEQVSELLIDMEASGFFEAALSYFSPDRVYCTKIISDFLEAKKITSRFITELISERMDKVSILISKIESLFSV